MKILIAITLKTVCYFGPFVILAGAFVAHILRDRKAEHEKDFDVIYKNIDANIRKGNIDSYRKRLIESRIDKLESMPYKNREKTDVLRANLERETSKTEAL